MHALGTALVIVAAVALILFPALYHWQTRGAWRRSQVGQSLMAFQGVLGLVMILAVWSALTHGHLPDWVRPAVWLAISVVAWKQVITMLRSQRRGRHERNPR